jgi:7-carboxy-7-deazaguanine synthase
MTIDEILQKVKSYGCKLVEVTGGEPLLQSNIHPLLKKLCDEGYEVLLETSGSINISNVDVRVKRIIDFKCPGSGMEKKNIWENVHYLKKDDEVKFVVGDKTDYEWAKEKIGEYRLTDKYIVLISPVYGAIDPKILAGWILEDNLNVRFQLQLQKYIWSPETRGV